MNLEVDYKLAVAVGDLSEAYDFLMTIAHLEPRSMYEAVRGRDPTFIEHCRCMEDPPASPQDFWTGFGAWTLSNLRIKHRHLWDKVMEAYLESPLHHGRLQRAAMWTDVEQLLKEFEV